jgi:tetratricopeptide (TPR) repeat protein
MSTRRAPRLLSHLSAVLYSLALLAGSTTVPACGPKQPPKGAHKHKAGPSGAEALLGEARTAVAAKQDEVADAKFAAAFEAKPDIAILEEHVRFLIGTNRLPRAVEVSKAYYDAQPADPKGFHLYSHALIAAGSFDAAADVAGKAIALDDNDAAAHENRGRALFLAGKGPEGIEELRRAAQLAPDNAEYLIELANALHRTGNVNEAALQLRSAIKLSPDHARAHLLLGVVLRDQMELDEAKVYLTKATELDPRDPRPWFELGILQNKLGDNNGAEASLGKSVELGPDNATNWYAYGEALRLNKKYDLAVTAYERAQTLKPPHPKAAAKRGLVLYEAKRYGEAEVFLTNAVREDPKNPYNYINLAVVLKQQKKYKLAIEMYEKFLELAPKEDGDVPKVKSEIRDLKKRV